MENNYSSLEHREYRTFKLVLKSILIGLSVSLVVVSFRYVITSSEQYTLLVYDYFRTNWKYIPFLFLILGLIGFFVGTLLQRNNMIGGSGFPQLKGILNGDCKHDWFSTLWKKYIGGILTIVSGLSLGSAGPSIQLGASVAEGIGNTLGESRMERKILIGSGASAGLAAVFNAPLAAVLFTLEEVFKYFSPTILLSTLAAAMTADWISKQVFGLEPIFNFNITTHFMLNDYWILVIFGLILGLMGVLYKTVVLKTQYYYKIIHTKIHRYKIVIPFVVAGIIGILFPITLGTGNIIINELNINLSISFLVLIFIVKFLFTMISVGSQAPGGIFFPLLVLGGIIGAIFGKIAIIYLGFDSNLFYYFILLGMVGYFTAIVKAPITAIVLLFELSGGTIEILPLTVVALISYVTNDLLKSSPIFETLFDHLLEDIGSIEIREEHSKKITIEQIVEHGSLIEGKQVHEITLPNRCMLITIKRGEKEYLPSNEFTFKPGDYLIVLTDLNYEVNARIGVKSLCNSTLSIH